MKKNFSAFLLMTMMVFSVGSIVSCSDLENELAQVEGTANDNAAAIESLNSELAALKTALSAAQADADAAMAAAKAAQQAGDAAKAEAEAAKAAAEQAKAEAIAAVMAEVEAIQTAIAQNVEAITNLSGSVNANAVEIEALQEEIKALQTAAAEHVYAITNLNGSIENHEMAIEDLETELSVLQNTLANYEKNLKDLGLLTDDFKEDIAQLTYAVTNLTTAVETNTNEIDGLKEQFEDVVAQVKTLNDSLIAIYDILGVLANQIQSVTFVPEYDTDIVYANVFTVGGTTTNFIATATYEVRPAKLAESLTSENLSFACVDVKETKAAAAPEYYKAQLLDADASTGRIVVRALIDDQTDEDENPTSDHKVLSTAGGTVALSLNIASIDVTELLIADSEPANVDMVSSEYVNVKKAGTTDATTLEIGFVSYDRTNKKYVVSTTSSNEVKMPWNTPVASSKKNLFAAEPVVLLTPAATSSDEQEILTLAEANETFGLELAVKYDNDKFSVEYEQAGSSIDPEKKDVPTKVTGKTLAATAELVASEDFEGDDAVGVNTTVNVYLTVVEGEDKTAATSELNATSVYKITNKQSDFSFADAKEVAWSYEDGDYAREIEQELAVVGFDKMVAERSYNFVTYVGQTPVTATVTALSSNDVKVTIPAGKLPYAQGEKAVYEFKGIVDIDKVDYEVAFNVTLAAMPADQVVDLGEIKTLGNTTGNMKEDVDVMSQIRTIINAADNNFNKDYAYSKNNVAALNALFTASSDKVAENDGVWVNGEKKTDPNAAGYASFALSTVGNTTDEVLEEKSTININKVEKYENTITVVKTYNVCGINFTVKAKVVTEEPQVGIAPNDFFVKDGVVKLDNGVFDLTYNTTTTVNETKSSDAYKLEVIDLRKYVHVTVPAGYEADYQLLYTLETPMYKDDKTTLLYGTKPSFTASTAIIDEDKANVPNALTWNVDLNSLTFKVALASKNAVDSEDKPVVFDTETITLTIPQLVTFAADSAVVVKYVPGQDVTANIAKALTVVDNHDNAVYNPYAKNVTEFFSGYYETLASGKVTSGVTTTGVDQDDFFSRIYDMEVVLPAADKEAEMIEVYLDGVKKDLSMVSYDFDNKTGILTLKKDNGIITGDVEFRVKVGLTYLYDNYATAKAPAQTATVSVVFSEDAEEEDETAEAVLPTPAKGQYVGELQGSKLIVNLGVGTLKTPVETIENPFAFVLDMGQGNYMYEPSMIFTEYEFEPATSTTGVIYGTNASGSAPIEYSDLTADSFTVYIGSSAVKVTKVAEKDMISVIEWK